MTGARVRALAALVVAGLLAAGCSSNHRTAVSTGTTTPPPTTTMLFVGSGFTVGDRIADPLRNAWPRLVFTESFPPGSVFVNAATRHATFASAVEDQVPIARELQPDTVFVLLGNNDLYAHNSPGEIENAANTLLAGLRGTGDTRMYVAGLPTIANGPPAAAANAAIKRSAALAGATWVDLSDVRVAVEPDGDIIPTKAVHRAVANQFERALKS